MQEDNKGFEYYLAKVFSYFFHPLLAPLAGIFIITYFFGDISRLTTEGKTYVVIITTISTLVLPLAFVPMMIYQKVIDSIEMHTARERTTPLFIIAVFYFFTWFIMYRLQAPMVYKVYFLISGVSVILSLVINFFTKISTHMVGMGGLTGTVFCLMNYSESNLQLLLVVLIGISGLTAYARLRLNAHQPLQIYIGYGLGLSVSALLFYLSSGSLDLI